MTDAEPKTLHRRKYLTLTAGMMVLPALPQMARAQTYPARPVRIVVGFTAGGIYDTYARMIAQWLTERLDQPFIIDNRVGAGGSIATETVVRAPADGYTLLFTGSNDAWNTALYDNLSFDYLQHIVPVAGISKGAGVLVVPPSFPAMTFQEFLAHVSSNPGKITVASDGVGSGPHVFWELFRSMTGLNMLPVPYRGAAPAVIDLLGNQVQAYFSYMAPVITHIRAGRLRALAVTSASRLELLPDVPAIGELVTGYDASGWNGIGAPRSTPSEIIQKLNEAINAGLTDVRTKQRIAEFGDSAFIASPGELQKYIADFTEKWGRVIRAANIKPPTLPMVGLIDVDQSTGGRNLAAFQKGLADLGYVHGRDVTVDHVLATGDKPLREVSANFVRRRASVIVTTSSIPAALAAKAATPAIPIVFGIAEDPVGLGLVASLNKPGGNVTGYSEVNTEVWSKRFEALRTLVPNAVRFALLVNPNNPSTPTVIEDARIAADKRGQSMEQYSVHSPSELETIFQELAANRIGGLLVSPDALFLSRRTELIGLAALHSIATAYWDRSFPDAGGLISYGSNGEAMYYQVGLYAGRILKGEKPSELPVVRASKFELVVNAKAAKALGLEISAQLLTVADQVLE